MLKLLQQLIYCVFYYVFYPIIYIHECWMLRLLKRENTKQLRRCQERLMIVYRAGLLQGRPAAEAMSSAAKQVKREYQEWIDKTNENLDREKKFWAWIAGQDK